MVLPKKDRKDADSSDHDGGGGGASRIPRTYRKSPARYDSKDKSDSVPKSPQRVKSPSRLVTKKAASSPAKPKSPSRLPKSPARKESSPVRTSGRPKSPARKESSPVRGYVRAKSPARGASPARNKSPARTVKKASPTKSAKSVAIKPSPPVISIPISESESDSDSDYEIPKPKATVKGRLRRTDISTTTNTTSSDITSSTRLHHDTIFSTHSSGALQTHLITTIAGGGGGGGDGDNSHLIRRSARLSQSRETPTKLLVKSNYEPIVKLTEFSDEDDVLSSSTKVEPKEKSVEAIIADKIGVAGVVLSLLQFLVVPTLIVYLEVFPDKFHLPTFSTLSHYLLPSTYYNPTVILSTTAYLLLITILTLLPLGGTFLKYNHQAHVMNGSLVTSFVVSLVLFVLIGWGGVPVADYLQTHWFQFAVTSVWMGWLLGAALYFTITSRRDVKGLLGRLSNWLEGAEGNPRLFGLVDVKWVLYRVAVITGILLNILFIYSSLDTYSSSPKSKNSSPPSPTSQSSFYTLPFNFLFSLLTSLSSLPLPPLPLLTVSSLHLILLLDRVLFERTLLTSHDLQKSGTGVLRCVGYLSEFAHVGPMVAVKTVAVMISGEKGDMATWKLGLAVGVFLAGCVLSRTGNMQKHAFRMNPYNPYIAHYESIPTNVGRKLLTSGLWGFVRHPNYLGDLLMNLAFLPFVCCCPASVAVYYSCAVVVARAVRDNGRCKARYGHAWEVYSQRVRYVLVPGVY